MQFKEFEELKSDLAWAKGETAVAVMDGPTAKLVREVKFSDVGGKKKKKKRAKRTRVQTKKMEPRAVLNPAWKLGGICVGDIWRYLLQ